MKIEKKIEVKGLTLMELLIGITILGVLMVLILPRFENVRATANTRVCVANLRGIASAMAVYETVKNLQVAWGRDVTDIGLLVKWQYLSTEPSEPYGVTSSTTYTLTSSSGNLPDRGICPVYGVTTYDPQSEHKWP